MDNPAPEPICLAVGPLETNCYLVPAAGGMVIIDPGGDAADILAALRSAGDSPVRAVLLTHGHFDHTAAADELSQALGVPTFAHAADGPLLGGRFAFFGMKPPAVPAAFFDDEALPEPIDGLSVLHTPGHSPGSVVYVTSAGVFCGDLIFRGSVGRVDLPGGDEATLVRSIRRLLDAVPHDLPIFPGHGPATTLSAELLDNPWVQEAASL